MHKYLFYPCLLLAAVVLTTGSCQKKVIDQFELLPPANKSLTLKMVNEPGNQRVLLQWDKYQGISFSRYQVRRFALVSQGGNIVQQNEVLANFADVGTLGYEDEVPANVVMAVYTIEAVWSETEAPVFSNAVEINFDVPFVRFHHDAQFDVLIDAETEILYFIDMRLGAVSAFSLSENRLVAQDTIHRELGYGTFAQSEGIFAKALYLPTRDGWLHILDPVTLATEKRLFLEELGISSVIVSGSSFIAATNEGNYGGKVKVYDRATHVLIDEAEYYSYLSLFTLPTKPRSFFSITHNLSPTQLTHFELADDGTIKSITEDSYHGDHPLGSEIVSVSPDGSRFISTGLGAIYSGNLVHEQTLAPWSYQSPPYRGYAFNENGTVLYAALRGEQTVVQIALPDGTVTRKLDTTGNPCRIFKNGDRLIVVNEVMTTTWPINRYYFVEQINLQPEL